MLKANPDVSAREVQAAWKEAGNRDPLNPTLYYQVRTNMGLARPRGRRGRPPRRAAAAAKTTSANVPELNSGYLSIEQALDRLISQAEDMNDSRLAAELRAARRRASAKLV
jgi:hypothetical protein